MEKIQVTVLYNILRRKKSFTIRMTFIGIGKTTVCKKVASTLEKSKNFDGFYTEEVRDRSGSRIGFDIVRVRDPDRRLSLARLKYVSLLLCS